MIGDLLKDRNGSTVQVQDFVLDLETGHAALQIVSWQHTERAKPVIAVAPFSPKLDVKQATQLAQALSSTEPPTLNRQLAAALHKTFGQEVYWSKYISRLQPAADAKFDSEKYELVPFATIKDKKIVASDGEALGTLADVGLSAAGDIVYCVLKSSDGALRAIPLAAAFYVVGRGQLTNYSGAPARSRGSAVTGGSLGLGGAGGSNGVGYTGGSCSGGGSGGSCGSGGGGGSRKSVSKQQVPWLS